MVAHEIAEIMGIALVQRVAGGRLKIVMDNG
jgi:hypothetical protein